MATNGLLQKFFVTPLVEDNHFQKSYPPPPGILSHFSPPPLEFHGNPLSSIMTPLEFSNFKHNTLEFSRFSFLRPPWNFLYLQQGGSGKFLEKPNVGCELKKVGGTSVLILTVSFKCLVNYYSYY